MSSLLETQDPSEANLHNQSLHNPFHLLTHVTTPFHLLQSLDLSSNEVSALPGLEQLTNLTHLDISRNWFKAIPKEVVHLRALTFLNARRNFLRPNTQSLAVEALASLPHLTKLDIQWNNKCKRQGWLDQLQKKLPTLPILMTVSFPAPVGSFVGESPSVRDPLQLRAQLEPWGTLVLRRRLVTTFSCAPTDPETCLRAEVMRRLLAQYKQHQMMDASGLAMRETIHVDGVPVQDENLLQEILVQLKKWVESKRSVKQERPSIRARNYMILRSPLEFGPKLAAAVVSETAETATPVAVTAADSTVSASTTTTANVGKRGSRKALLAQQKWEQHQVLWDLAKRAMKMVDEDFSEKFTALAVTHGFSGSPHIDKQNIGPFYGMSLGNFKDGEGGICVEYDPKRIVQVNTKGRLGKVDGRFPHWVVSFVCFFDF